MPGKVNPVIPEVVTQVAAQVIGNDAAITIGGMQGHFELNVFVPLIARNLLQSIKLLASASRLLDEKCVSGIEANLEQMRALRRGDARRRDRAQPAHRLRQGERDRQEGRGLGPFAARGRARGRCLGGRARRGARLPQDGAPARLISAGCGFSIKALGCRERGRGGHLSLSPPDAGGASCASQRRRFRHRSEPEQGDRRPSGAELLSRSRGGAGRGQWGGLHDLQEEEDGTRPCGEPSRCSRRCSPGSSRRAARTRRHRRPVLRSSSPARSSSAPRRVGSRTAAAAVSPRICSRRSSSGTTRAPRRASSPRVRTRRRSPACRA